MIENRPPKICRSYLPGHCPHWIQVNLARKEGGKPLPGRLIDVRLEGTVVVEVGGKELQLWNHDSDRLAEAARLAEGDVFYQVQWGLLWIASNDGGRYAFCVARLSDGPKPCPARDPEGSLIELLKESGGLTIPISDLGTGPS